MDTQDIQLFLKQNITYLLSYLGALQGIILALVVLFFPREFKISNRILSVFIFILAYLLLIARVVEMVDSPYLRLIYAIRFLAPISLYLYIKSLFHQLDWQREIRHLWVLLFDFIVLYIMTTIKIDSIGDQPLWTSFWLASSGWAWFILINAFYFSLIWREIKKYKFKVYRNFSSLNNLSLKWVNQISIGFLILIIIDILVGFISLLFPQFYGPYHGLINTVAYTAFMYFVTIKGKLNPEIYKLQKMLNKNIKPPQAALKGQNRETSDEKRDLAILSQQVIKVIREEKLYKEMGLSVNEVADKVGSQTYLVSSH